MIIPQDSRKLAVNARLWKDKREVSRAHSGVRINGTAASSPKVSGVCAAATKTRPRPQALLTRATLKKMMTGKVKMTGAHCLSR
jgi:hypothetical protein